MVWVILIDALALLFGIAGIYHVSAKAGLPFNIRSVDNKLLIISETSIASNKLSSPNLVSLNGQIMRTLEEVEFLCDGLAIGDPMLVEVRDSGKSITSTIALTPYYSLRYLIVLIIVATLYFVLGVIVFFRQASRDKAAVPFHWLMVCTFLVITSTWGRYTVFPVGLGVVIRGIFSTAYAFLPATFVHLTFCFPKVKWSKFLRVLGPLYLIAFIISIAMVVLFTQASGNKSIALFENYLAVFDLCRYGFAACGLFSVGNFIHSYIYSSEELERRKLRWILLGTAVGPISFIALWQIPQLLTSHGLIDEEFILLIMGIIPITYSISMVRYNVLNIDFIINRSTVYATLIVTLSGIYVAIIAGFIALVGVISVSTSYLVSAFAALIIALIFEPARRKIQKFVDKKFFRLQYDFREAQKVIISDIHNSLSVEEVGTKLVSQINSFIPLENISLFKESDGNINLVACINLSYDKQVAIIHHSEILAHKSKLPVVCDHYFEHGTKNIIVQNDNFKNIDLAASFPLVSESSEIIGYLFCGKKKSGLRFSLEDVELITALTVQSALIIQRIQLQNKLLLEQAEGLRLKELSELKSYFVSSVSHELKTPLTSIKMFSELLQITENISASAKSEYLGIIDGESERLSRLIDNILDFSKIERGVKEYVFQKASLNEIVEGIIKTMRYQFDKAKMKIQYQPMIENAIVLADVDSIIEAVMNIMSNAIKYSEGEKKVTIDIVEDGKYYGVSVCDEGIGIPPENIDTIFEPFLRLKSSGTNHVAGTGLGLAIVKHIVEAHHGRIEVKSEIGKGSIFTLLFPKYEEVV